MSITVNIYYTGENGNARKFAEEMIQSGTVVKDSILTIADAAKRANMTVSEFESKTGVKA